MGKNRDPSRRDGERMDPTTVFMAAVHAHHARDGKVVDELVRRLADQPQRRLAGEVQRLLEDHVSRQWSRGWQPAVLDRVVRRRVGAGEAALLRCVLAADAASYEAVGREVAPEWMAQLEAVEARRWWSPDRPYLLQIDRSWAGVLGDAVRLVDALTSAPELPLLSPPPADWHPGMATGARSNLPSGLLDKVRALLAKAESTSFDAEAEAFTAKAQELMTRHRIDRAVLESAAREGDAPGGRHLFVDDPYADAKALLLQVVCSANGGHAVWSKDMGASTVFALPDELDIIEDLFTSLLVQATAALRREGSKQDRFGRSRTTRFRRSFLVAFAVRIGDRLQEAADAAVADAEAETGRSVALVLASQADAAERAAHEAFPGLSSFAPRATDGEGWFAGTRFGDRADLGVGAPVERRTAS